ncbi:MAG: hypothetical protein V1648_04790 [Candidatus Aenigmatarchaeota archaeon]
MIVDMVDVRVEKAAFHRNRLITVLAPLYKDKIAKYGETFLKIYDLAEMPSVGKMMWEGNEVSVSISEKDLQEMGLAPLDIGLL